MINLWNKEGMPHKNWQIIGEEDLGYGTYEICQMCGYSEIRYVHIMNHVHYKPLRVGCICAEKMSAGYNAKAAELRMKRIAAKKRRDLLKEALRLHSLMNQK